MALSQNLVKRSLGSHSWLGLMASALMYVICLSGSLLVFHAELEQWEQADAPVTNNIDLQAAEATFNRFVANGEGVTPHMYLVLPTAESPYARIATETQSWFLNTDGGLGQKEHIDWSKMLLDLHLYLHLPNTLGIMLVSALGAVLVGLIISGFLAHPGLLKDAFRFRRGSSEQLSQTDLHNRLSVWATPFHLTIAITGAYFGLVLPLLAIVAETEFDGDRDQVVSLVFGEEPNLPDAQGPFKIRKAIDSLRDIDPSATPFTVIVHDAETAKPLLEIYARHPQRLAWGESYQFTVDGTFIQKAGWTDGSPGQQILYSLYRLHFGTFDGQAAKLLYLVLGLALTVVAATGVNIWLAKRRKEDGLTDLWTGIVWGSPLALVASALISLLGIGSPLLTFWLTLVAAGTLSLVLANSTLSGLYLRSSLIAGCASLLLVHIGTFGSDSFAQGALWVNLGLCLVVVLLAVDTRKKFVSSRSEGLIAGAVS